MRRWRSAAALLLFGSVEAAHAATTPEVAQPEPGFVEHLYAQLRSRPGNLFYAPASIRLALSMAFAGARGDTANEMQRALGIGSDAAAHDAKLLADWETLASPASHFTANDAAVQKYAEEDIERRSVVLKIANRLWAEKGKAFAKPFLDVLATSYRAPLGEVDFVNAPEPSRLAINAWVSDATAQKIKELLPPRTVNDATRLVITNAVYFKASWNHPFEAGSTKNEPFYTSATSHKPAALMHQIEHFSLARFSGGKLLELRYGDGDLVMDVVLPDARDGLAKVESELVRGALPGWLNNLHSERVDVKLPKFKMSAALGLVDTMKAMGMKKAFKYPEADFSGIDGTHELFISDVIHQAFVAVDEKGTEAAAATAVSMKAGAAPPREEPIIFHADRPFLFVLRDTRNDEILFMGRLVDPHP